MATTTATMQRHPACKGPSGRSPVWGIIIVIVAILAASMIVYNFASDVFDKAKPSTVAASGVYRQYTVGEQDEVKVHLPPRSWWDLDIDKPVIIRLANGEKYERRPDGSIRKIEASGALTPVSTVGDEIPGSNIYLLAKKGEKMVKVSLLTTKK